MTTPTTTPKDSTMIHVSLSQILPSAPPALERPVGRHAALPSIEDVRAENVALQSAQRSEHVALKGRNHLPESAALVDQAESAWFAAHNKGRVA